MLHRCIPSFCFWPSLSWERWRPAHQWRWWLERCSPPPQMPFSGCFQTLLPACSWSQDLVKEWLNINIILLYFTTNARTHNCISNSTVITLELEESLTIDEEEEGTSFIGYSSSHQGLPCTCRAVKQDASGRLRETRDDYKHLRRLRWLTLEYKETLLWHRVCLRVLHLNSYGLEQSRMSERKLHHLFDLSQLLPTASNVIITNVVKTLLFILSKKAGYS